MTVEAVGTFSRLRRITAWAARVNFERTFALVLLIASVLAGFTTYGALTGVFPVALDPRAILLLLYLDLTLLLLLGAIVIRRLVMIWVERRRGLAGSQLHGQLVLLFSLVAMTPTIIVAFFSALFFNLGVDAWFSDRVSTAIKESLVVAQAYLHEHQQNIAGDVLAMANDINREGPLFLNNPQRLRQVLDAQTALRGLTEAVIFDVQGNIRARAGFSLTFEFAPELPAWALQRARNGEVVVLSSDTDDRVRALVKLDSYTDSYLFVGRLVDSRVLAHMDASRGAVLVYESLEGQRKSLQITFAMIYGIVALLLLMVAVWVGLAIANRLVRPIGDLIQAADRVGAGQLTVRVSEVETGNELASLGRAFNRMTDQLATQQRALIEANRQLDTRRRFTEAVLSGVSAGVIGLDDQGRINLPNRPASELLGIDLESRIGQNLETISPEMAALIQVARRRPNRAASAQISLAGANQTRTLLVRAVAEEGEQGPVGYVVTFDDVTELLSAQRKAAWADVARRIAHEIKNPLTPIQLSAERLKRKYLKEITSDPETFTICTDTIVRQVSDIGRMVDEFSSFARMPAPVMLEEDLRQLIEQAVFLQRSAHPGITIEEDLPRDKIMRLCDARQIRQVLTNLLQNAVDAIAGREERDGQALSAAWIGVKLAQRNDGTVLIEVSDNGKGLPSEGRERLTEPYVTTRTKGTGLGLAIVKKIMEDHGGDVVLEDRDGGGACVRLIFASPTQIDKDSAAPSGEQIGRHTGGQHTGGQHTGGQHTGGQQSGGQQSGEQQSGEQQSGEQRSKVVHGS